LPIPPGMSNRLKIKQSYENTILNDFDTNILEDEWVEDVGGFWEDKVPEIINQSDSETEPIPEDEINHIKVIISKY